MPKPGYKTTEFLVTLAVGLAVLIASVADYLPPRYAAISASVVAGLYAVSRGLAKVPTPIVPPTTVAPPPNP
jgi:type IV secretory pathway protease TraF